MTRFNDSSDDRPYPSPPRDRLNHLPGVGRRGRSPGPTERFGRETDHPSRRVHGLRRDPSPCLSVSPQRRHTKQTKRVGSDLGSETGVLSHLWQSGTSTPHRRNPAPPDTDAAGSPRTQEYTENSRYPNLFRNGVHHVPFSGQSTQAATNWSEGPTAIGAGVTTVAIPAPYDSRRSDRTNPLPTSSRATALSRPSDPFTATVSLVDSLPPHRRYPVASSLDLQVFLVCAPSWKETTSPVPDPSPPSPVFLPDLIEAENRDARCSSGLQ